MTLSIFDEKHKADAQELTNLLMLADYKKITELMPDGTYSIDPNDPRWKRMYDEYGPVDFKALVSHAVGKVLTKHHFGRGIFVDQEYQLLQIEFDTNPTIKLREVNPDLYGKPITFDCTIISVDARKTYIKRATFRCPICGRKDEVKCDEDRKIQPYQTKCVNYRCKRAQMVADMQGAKLGYTQTVIIQEPLEEARNNSPVTFVAKLIDRDVGEAFISQKKRITGMFKSFVDTKKIEQDIHIDIIELEDREEKKLILPSPELIESYKKLSETEGWCDKLIASYAPHIWGYKDIKLSILLMLVGGVKTHKRADINLFLCGDPSLAKSEMLRFAEKVTQKSAYTTGKGASGVGLTIAIVKEENLGRFMAQAGVYPLCDGGFVFVDEFDKMTKEDRSSMHEVLEHGRCSVAKAGIKMTLPARVATLAAANPKFGKYDVDLSLGENIDLPPTILSRFDMIWLMRDKVNELEDNRKAEHVLKEFESEGEAYQSPFNTNELMAMLNYMKELKPTLCPGAKSKLMNMYQKMRKTSSKEETTPVGIRQLEGLVRLCMAHAKLHFRDTVTEEDIDVVMELFKSSFKSYGIDLDRGGTQEVLFKSVEDMNKEQAFWHTWNETEIDGRVDRIELIKKLQGTKQFPTDADANKYITKMDVSSRIMIKGDGRYEKV